MLCCCKAAAGGFRKDPMMTDTPQNSKSGMDAVMLCLKGWLLAACCSHGLKP